MEAIELRSAGRAPQATARINRLVVDRLHEAHGGSLNIECQPGRGTRVRISLPALNGNAVRLVSQH